MMATGELAERAQIDAMQNSLCKVRLAEIPPNNNAFVDTHLACIEIVVVRFRQYHRCGQERIGPDI